MTKQDFYDLIDAVQALKVAALGIENNVANWRVTATDTAKLLVLVSNGSSYPYSAGNFWAAVSTKMTEYGQVYGVDSDEAALQDLVADLTYPAAHNSRTLLAAYIATSWPLHFTYSNGEYQPLDLIAATALTDGQTATSNAIRLPANAKLLTAAMTLATVTNPTSVLSMATSVDGETFGSYEDINTATEAETANAVIDCENRPKYCKFKITQTNVATVSLKAELK